MITGLLFKIIAFLMTILSYMIPNWFIPTPLETAFSSVINDSMKFNGVFPMADILFALSLVLFFHILIFTVNASTGFISLIRGGGGSKL